MCVPLGRGATLQRPAGRYHSKRERGGTSARHRLWAAEARLYLLLRDHYKQGHAFTMQDGTTISR